MSHDDEVCLELGREVVRMIHELRGTVGADYGYTRRGLTFRGGHVFLFIANDPELAEVFDTAAAKRYDVETIVPTSQSN